MCVCELRRSYKSIHLSIQSPTFSTIGVARGGGGGNGTIGGATGNTTQFNAVISEHLVAIVVCHMLP